MDYDLNKRKSQTIKPDHFLLIIIFVWEMWMWIFPSLIFLHVFLITRSQRSNDVASRVKKISHHCTEKYSVFAFCKGKEWETSVLCLSSINQCNINDSFEDHYLQKGTQLPSSDKTIIILHLHDKCVCMCMHFCMYVWVLKRALATVRHKFSSFISVQKIGRGLFNVEPGSLCLCSSSECSSLATVRALKSCLVFSPFGIVMTLRLFVCMSTYIYLFCHQADSRFFHTYM